MDISKAALPPIQPSTTPKERAHPRFGEYRRYVSAMSCQLVEASPFSCWLRGLEEAERVAAAGGFDHTFNVDWSKIPENEHPPGALADGWWKHRFGPDGRTIVARFGPYDTKAEADNAGVTK